MAVEQRQSQRKVLRVKALLTIGTTEPITVQTMDVGCFGMSLVDVPAPLAIGQMVDVSFAMFFDGMNHDISVNARISYCLKLDDAGFKVGMQFLALDTSEGAALIARYIGS